MGLFVKMSLEKKCVFLCCDLLEAATWDSSEKNHYSSGTQLVFSVRLHCFLIDVVF